jgi:hypothetical protein
MKEKLEQRPIVVHNSTHTSLLFAIVNMSVAFVWRGANCVMLKPYFIVRNRPNQNRPQIKRMINEG